MKFTALTIPGAYLIELTPFADERGFFARSWCRQEFVEQGLHSDLVQCSISYNHKKGTLRGMHFQAKPYEEVKLVRCTRGAIYDVLLDLRPDSTAYCCWFGTELTAQNYRMLYIPEGVAHGFQTLADETEVFYQMSEFYHAEAGSGVRWNDPAFCIQWPPAERVISERDQQYPDYVR